MKNVKWMSYSRDKIGSGFQFGKKCVDLPEVQSIHLQVLLTSAGLRLHLNVGT